MSLIGTQVKVSVDVHGEEDWKDCFVADLGYHSSYRLPKDWKKGSHFSLSASTGALSDNHDVLGMLLVWFYKNYKTFSRTSSYLLTLLPVEFTVTKPENFEAFKEIEANEETRPSVEISLQSQDDVSVKDVGAGVNSLAYEVKELEFRVKKLEHSLEHAAEKSKLGLLKQVTALEEQESKLEKRMQEMEDTQHQNIGRTITDRLNAMEQRLSTEVERRLVRLENKLTKDVKEVVTESGGGWVVPLVVVSILFTCVVAFLFYQQRKLNKRDKLF